MPRKPVKRLTPLETLIMNVLWDQSPAPVKRVRERLEAVKPMAYSTVLTMMRILREKGFLSSERQGKADLYRPLVTREDMGRRSLSEVIESFFSGSAEALVSQVLNGQSLSAEELRAIRAKLDEPWKTERMASYDGSIEPAGQRPVRSVRPAECRARRARPPRPGGHSFPAHPLPRGPSPVVAGSAAEACRRFHRELALDPVHSVDGGPGTVLASCWECCPSTGCRDHCRCGGCLHRRRSRLFLSPLRRIHRP